MVNMEDSKSIRSKFKKSVQTLLKPFQKKDKNPQTKITTENDENLHKNEEKLKLSDNDNDNDKEIHENETKEYQELLNSFIELEIKSKTEEESNNVVLNVKNESESIENESNEESSDDDEIFSNINRQDSGDSGYDENRLIKSITQELEQLKKDNQPKKVVCVRRGPVWTPRVTPNTEPYQRQVNRQTLSGGNVVVRSKSPELTEITQEVLNELILRVPEAIANELVASNNEILLNEINSLPELTNDLMSPEIFTQISDPSVQGFEQYTDQGIFPTVSQINEPEQYYGEVLPNVTEPGFSPAYFLESPKSLLSPENAHESLEPGFESNFDLGSLSQPFLSTPSVYFEPSPNSSIDLTSPNSEAFGNAYEFTLTELDQGIRSEDPIIMLDNGPDLSVILNSPPSSSNSPLYVPNDQNIGCEQACKQLELNSKSLYYNGYYSAPSSAESLSPGRLSNISNEVRMDIPIISPSSDTTKMKMKKNLPDYKKDLKALKDSFMNKKCCTTFGDKLSDYFNKLPDVTKKHLITVTNDEPLQSIQKCIIKAMEGILYEENIDLQLAIIFYLCERVLKQNMEEYLLNFGLDVLRTSVLWCFKQPIVTQHIVKNIYTAYQILGKTYKEPIFCERDRNGDNLIIFCARSGDDYADVLAALCDVRENCPPLFDINHKNNEGCNALHVACITHSKEKPRLHIVHVLLNHANISVWEGENKGGLLSLHYAVNSPNCDFDLILYHFQGLDKKDWHKLANYKRDNKGTRTTPKAMAMSRESLEPSYPKDVSNFLERCKDNKYATARKN